MYAKLSEAYLKEDCALEFIELFQKSLAASAEHSEGNCGSYLLINHEKREVIALSLWESLDVMQNTTENAWNQSLRNAAIELFIAAPTDQIYKVEAQSSAAKHKR